MHKLNGIIAGITISRLTSPARLELGEPRDVSLRILFAQSIVMPRYLPMGVNLHPQHSRIGGLLLRHKKLPILHSVSTDLRIIAMELVPVV